MGLPLMVGCYLVALAPAAAIFAKIIAPDPLKIILFVFGAFMWLLSLLVTSFIWFAVLPLREQMWFSLVISLVLQELARIACFVLLKKAQRGLSTLSARNVALATGSSAGAATEAVRPLAHARHLLALVCGTGMGVTASLFISMNVFAALAGSGVIGGLPATMQSGGVLYAAVSRYLPLHLALSAMLLSLLHITWTILVWDSCHRFWLPPRAEGAISPAIDEADGITSFKSITIAVTTHALSTGTSCLSGAGLGTAAIGVKAALLLFNTCYIYTIIRHDSVTGLFRELAFALRDWLTLAALRSAIKGSRCSAGDDSSEVAESNTAVAVRTPLAGEGEEEAERPEGEGARRRAKRN